MSKNLYQKYRPYAFNEVVGQDYVKTILLNSIKENMIQNTYLFNGPRGTGKTTIARIFSRLLNCDSIDNPGEDGCESCNYFKEQTEYDDIYELDAASNNGVDDIRKIIDSVKYQPIRLKKKIYIIDEVHMLSKGAFNALLKTLEEPQDKVVFILATTEVGKIPATILSRCQRFDFERIPPNLMIEHFKSILKAENVTYDDEALIPIAKLSDGCVRDGLSLLQKVVSVSKDIKKEDVNNALGMVEHKNYDKLCEYIEKKQTDEVLKFWEELYLTGIDLNNFIVDFQYYLKTSLIEESSYEKLKMIYIVNDIEQRAVYTKNLNTLIEVMLIEMTNNNLSNSSFEKNKQENKNEIDIKTVQEEEVKGEKLKVEKTKVVKPKITVTNSRGFDNVVLEDEDFIFDILFSASKDKRMEVSKSFMNAGEKLQSIKKFGLAKFFLEAQIKAANENSIIVTIEEELKDSFIKRHDKLCEEIEEIEVIKIITETQWEKIKVDYINKQQNKEENMTNEKDKEIINKLESKFNKKIKVIKG